MIDTTPSSPDLEAIVGRFKTAHDNVKATDRHRWFFHYIEDVPRLVQQVKRLQVQVAELQGKLWEAADRYQKFSDNLTRPRDAQIASLQADLEYTRHIVVLQQAVVEAADDVLVATSPHDDRRAWSNLREAMAHLNAANVPITQGLPDQG